MNRRQQIQENVKAIHFSLQLDTSDLLTNRG